MKICVKMTGCRNNRFELDQILSWAINNNVGIVNEEEAEYCIINTCTVTHSADKKSRQLVRKTKNSNERLKTIVFGCGARMQREEFKKVAEVDYLVPDLESVLDLLSELNDGESEGIKNAEDIIRSRALVQIQDGCENFCAYCIIAAARGRSISHPEEEIVEQINKLVDEGYNEVVLTGINIGAWGAGKTTEAKESKFAELLQAILDKTEVERIRISSLGPEYFDERLYKVLQNPRICRHIHLSIQSGSSSVLEKMKRNYDADKVEEVITRTKKDIPGIAITTDIIIGFPTETDEEFKETIEFVKKNPLAKAHVFPYSIRKNTIAATMEQVDDEVKKKRAKGLQSLVDMQREDFIKEQIGQKTSVLWESEYEGLTDNYIRVKSEEKQVPKSITEVILSEDVIQGSVILYNTLGKIIDRVF